MGILEPGVGSRGAGLGRRHRTYRRPVKSWVALSTLSTKGLETDRVTQYPPPRSVPSRGEEPHSAEAVQKSSAAGFDVKTGPCSSGSSVPNEVRCRLLGRTPVPHPAQGSRAVLGASRRLGRDRSQRIRSSALPRDTTPGGAWWVLSDACWLSLSPEASPMFPGESRSFLS